MVLYNCNKGKEVIEMESYLITASIDGVNIDFETELQSATKPSYYDIYDLCAEHGCPFFYVTKLDKNNQVIDQVEW